MKYRICKSFEFSAAHMLSSSWTEKCQKIHGHNYRVEVVLSSSELNKDGMVLDFGKLKQAMKELIAQFDHSYIVSANDLQPEQDNVKKSVVMGNPTSENIARTIYARLNKIIQQEFAAEREKSSNGYMRTVEIDRIRVYETPNSWSEFQA